MKWKIGSIVISVSLLLALLASCAGGGSIYPEIGAAQSTVAATAATTGAYIGDQSGAPSAAPVSEENIAAERKIIWDASLDIEAKDAVALYSLLSAWANGQGGYEHSNDIQHYETHSVVNAVFKIPPQSLRAFIDYAGDQGTVVNSRMGSEDITENYYDSQIRLETKRKSLERYYELLRGAANVEEIVYIQQIIDGITEEIESLEGRLRVWDGLTEMATVSVYIRQDNDPVKIERDTEWGALSVDDMGKIIRNGLVSVFSGILTFFQWLAIVIAVTSPLWITALIIIWIVSRRRKKKRVKALEEANDGKTTDKN